MTTDYCDCGHPFGGHDHTDTGGTCSACACTGYRNAGPNVPATPNTGGPEPLRPTLESPAGPSDAS